MQAIRVLLVEDDVHLSNELKQQLAAGGFLVEHAFDGVVAERYLNYGQYDIVLADINLPGKSGFELVKYMRGKGIATPTIIITAFGEIDDKLHGFNCGADDYITKPFYFQELLARIKAILKRSETFSQSERLIVADMIIDTRTREVKRGDRIIRLTGREFEILLMLVNANGQPVSKADLLEKVWGTSFGANTNTIEVFINLLRNKIDKNMNEKLIRTRVGVGYYIASH